MCSEELVATEIHTNIRCVVPKLKVILTSHTSGLMVQRLVMYFFDLIKKNYLVHVFILFLFRRAVITAKLNF